MTVKTSGVDGDTGILMPMKIIMSIIISILNSTFFSKVSIFSNFDFMKNDICNTTFRLMKHLILL